MSGIAVTWRRREILRLLGVGVTGAYLSLHSGQSIAETLRSPRKPRLIMLDPGHGGVDPGAIGVSGTHEKSVTLATAKEAASLLEASGRYRVKLTRTDDEFVALGDRVERAQTEEADLFMSIHADANPDHGVRGASVYTLSEQASDAEAAELAARENRADKIAGVDLSHHEPIVSEILFDLARRQTNNLSQRFAQALVFELAQEVPLLIHTHRAAAFVVLKAPDIPSALVELGCLSNLTEEKELRIPTYQHKLAQTLVRSVDDYFAHV